METALVIGLLCIGAAAGAMITAAWFSDWTPPASKPQSGPDDFESRVRRVQ